MFRNYILEFIVYLTAGIAGIIYTKIKVKNKRIAILFYLGSALAFIAAVMVLFFGTKYGHI